MSFQDHMLNQIVETLLILAREDCPYDPDLPVYFVMDKWKSVYVNGVEYALKLEKRG